MRRQEWTKNTSLSSVFLRYPLFPREITFSPREGRKRGFDSLHPLSPARSSRARARQAPLVAAPINETYPKGESVAPKGRVSGPKADQANLRCTTFIFAFARSFLAGYSAAGPACGRADQRNLSKGRKRRAEGPRQRPKGGPS